MFLFTCRGDFGVIEAEMIDLLECLFGESGAVFYLLNISERCWRLAFFLSRLGRLEAGIFDFASCFGSRCGTALGIVGCHRGDLGRPIGGKETDTPMGSR